MSLGGTLAVEAGVVAGLMLCVWLVSVAVHDASLVDIVWGVGFAAVAWVAFARLHNRLSLPILTTVWGARLAGYLALRNLGHGEDRRYQAMRRRAGDAFWWKSLFTVFGVQAALMWVVSLPLQVGQRYRPGVRFVGFAIWALGVTFESVGDFQLARFKRNPHGEVMDRGLWRYTRHPNYFGDFCVWWGLYLASGAWWTFPGPLVMTILLMRVSGAGLLEKTIVTRRPAYADYIRRTSGFFPLPPKRGAG